MLKALDETGPTRIFSIKMNSIRLRKIASIGMLIAAAFVLIMSCSSPVICVDQTGNVRFAFMSGTGCHVEHNHAASDDLEHSDFKSCGSCTHTELASEFMIAQSQGNLSRMAQVGSTEVPATTAGYSPELLRFCGLRASAVDPTPPLWTHFAFTVLIC